MPPTSAQHVAPPPANMVTRITRHNAVRDVIFSAAQSAALRPSREAQGLIPESLSRPADVFLPTWQGGRDVHVISPLQQTLIHEAAFSPGHALEVGVRRKLTTHLQACRSIGVNFIPIVAETLGGLGEETINIIGAIGNAIDRRVTMTHSTSSTKKHLFHRLAIAHFIANKLYLLQRMVSAKLYAPPPSYLLVCCFCTFVLFDIT